MGGWWDTPFSSYNDLRVPTRLFIASFLKIIKQVQFLILQRINPKWLLFNAKNSRLKIVKPKGGTDIGSESCGNPISNILEKTVPSVRLVFRRKWDTISWLWRLQRPPTLESLIIVPVLLKKKPPKSLAVRTFFAVLLSIIQKFELLQWNNVLK